MAENLHCVQDELSTPYEEGEYVRTLEDDLMLVEMAKRCNLEFIPGSPLDGLRKSLKNHGT